MKSIVILSGKGGVGKSSVAASLAVVFSKDKIIVCADCDVDASNLSLLFGLNTEKYAEWKPISTNQIAVIDYDKCTGCGKCKESCYFNAISLIEEKPKINDFGCEGCGVCEIVCPFKAISLVDIDNAYIGYSKTKNGFYISSAQLLAGNSGSGKVVFEVKKKAKQIQPDAEMMIIDASAGIGCPVIASVTGNDYAVLITEPTPSSYSDMIRALEVVNHFKIRKGVIINKYDINEGFTKRIVDFANKNNIPILSKIPFDKAFVEAMTEMVPIVEYDKRYEKVFEDIKNIIIEELAK
jgi:MinD superfamily P-loop ATPase